MTIQLKLDPETETRLVAEARTQGVPPDEFAGRLLSEALVLRNNPSGNLTVEEFHTTLQQLAEGSENLPSLPTETFTR